MAAGLFLDWTAQKTQKQHMAKERGLMIPLAGCKQDEHVAETWGILLGIGRAAKISLMLTPLDRKSPKAIASAMRETVTTQSHLDAFLNGV